MTATMRMPPSVQAAFLTQELGQRIGQPAGSLWYAGYHKHALTTILEVGYSSAREECLFQLGLVEEC